MSNFTDENYKWYSLQLNFYNIDVNQKCSFLRKKLLLTVT